MSTATASNKNLAQANAARVMGLIRARTRTPAFKRHLQKLLVELCRIDTTPSPDMGRMRNSEDACFRVIERELAAVLLPGSKAEVRRAAINPDIKSSPHFSLLHFTKTSARPAGLSPEAAYSGRSNLVAAFNATDTAHGKSIALNAHIDVVAPYIPPRVSTGIVHGRGACDDKGPVVSIVAALRLLSEVMPKAALKLNSNIVAMFVIEEETGGNGSLSVARDQSLGRLYDSVLVCECTGLKIYPANRGAVWYRAELKPPAGTSALELASFVVEELEREGSAIRAESKHPLFPQRPVQTCHGMIGAFGEHPSRICGEVQFGLNFAAKAAKHVQELVVDCLESGLSAYVGTYGDKTKVTDPATRKPMVARHYDLRPTSKGFEVVVHGAAGHMGSIRERDGAITKMAYLVRSLVASRKRIETVAGSPFRLELWATRKSRPPVPRESSSLVVEGGQGFIPTHTIEEVMTRLREAATRGAENFLRQNQSDKRADNIVKVTYEKLHNVAFDGDPDSISMRRAIAAAKSCGIWKDEPVLGWTVSCDARLFATEHPGMDVLTFGPGQLTFAHSDHEQISLEEIRQAVEFLAVFLLLQTGTLR